MACRLSYLEEVRIIKHIMAVSGRASAVIMTRANYLDKAIQGEDRLSLIPHDPRPQESEKHPYEPEDSYTHSTSFLLPHAKACRIDFDERCQTEKKYDKLTFGTEDSDFQYCVETRKGSGKFGEWQPKGKVYEISGTSKKWDKAILIRGHTVYASFKCDYGFNKLWGYRYMCRPATEAEMASVRGWGQEVPADEFVCATSPQSNGGNKWERAVAEATGNSAVRKFEGFMNAEAEWFGSLTIDKQILRQQTMKGSSLMQYLEASWGADGSGKVAGGYPFWTHVLQGRCKLSIGGNPSSSLKLLEMIIRVAVAVGTSDPAMAMLLILASVAAQAKSGNQNELWRELHSQERSDTVRISNYARAAHVCEPVSMGPASFSADDFNAFMTQPLSSFVDFSDYISSVDKEHGRVPDAPPFDLSGHPDAETVNAKATMKRITDDCEYYAEKENNAKATVCVGITPQLMQAYEKRQDAAGGPSKDISPAFASEAKSRLASLKSILQDALHSESARLDAATAHMLSEANSVPGTSEKALRFKLLQRARLQAAITLPHLVACLVSTNAAADIRSLNPFVSKDQVERLLNATAGVVLVANRVSQLQRTIGCVDDVTKAISRCIDAKKMRKEIGGLIGNLLSKRHYGCKGDTGTFTDPIDPRFLLFEYMTTFVLRKAQVYLVNTFIQRAKHGGKNAHGEDINSMVHQMIMGAGKTTIIGPLLALMLADGKSLVTQVVPNALLTMSRNVMWGRFCNVVVKPVFTLTFDRSWPTIASVYQRMYEKMLLARQSGGIVVTTPSAIKSIVNKYVELLNSVSEAPMKRLISQTKTSSKKEASARASARLGELQNCSDTADAIARIMNLWSDRERGVLLMDEVDMLLHPLRSELNFPIGEKFPLTPSPSRWNLPMHLIDTILKASRAAIRYTTSQEASEPLSTSDLLVKKLQDALISGFRSQRLQSVPHLVLLDASFYEEEIRGLLVQRAISWMKAHHVFEDVDVVPDSDTLEAYVLRGNLASKSDVLSKIHGLPGNVIQILNLAKDCTGSFLPHILAKIDRVSFGLLQPEDLVVLKGKEQPLSRKLLGIPFVGKDVPSSAAEFAQPDVLISATILAYRYEGLRENDLKSAVRLLKEAMQLEAGPKSGRPAYVLFEKWVSTACGRRGPDFKRSVMDLELFQLGDAKQMRALFELLRMEPEVIHHYLREIAFPSTMHQQRVKISASGQELGSDILFGRRLGFSGTPSNLLPVDIVPCHFEKGSEGKIIRSLTDDEVTMEAPMSRALSEDGAKPWSVKGILDMIAQSTDPEYRALIDTGALITGYSNEEVARYLVDNGLRHLQGINGINVVEGLLGSNNKAKTGVMRFEGNEPAVKGLNDCIAALRDAVDFDVPKIVPVSEPYTATLQKMVDANANLVRTSHQKQIVQIVMQQVDDALKSKAARASSGAKKGLNSEMTREKEREQEQQKQKQQQQQNESMFAKDESKPYAWDVDILSSIPRSSNGEFPFYPLNSFSPRSQDFSFRVPGQSEPTVFPAVKPLEFPSNVLQSKNFAPLSRADATKPLRLKNVSIILDWFPNIEEVGCHHMIVLTLSEAESLRRLIQAKNKGERTSAYLGDKVAIAIVKSPDGIIVEATKNYPGFVNDRDSTESKKKQGAVANLETACLKFVNNDMYYGNEEISALLSAIGSSTIETRRAYFEASIVARRRSRKSWTGTPLRAVFAFDNQGQYTEMLKLVSACQERLQAMQQDMVEACDAADADGNGFLSQPEIISVFQNLQVPVTPAQISALVKLMDTDGDNAIDYAEFAEMFTPEASEQDQIKIMKKGADGARNRRNNVESGESKVDEAEKRRKRDEERRQRRMKRLEEEQKKRRLLEGKQLLANGDKPLKLRDSADGKNKNADVKSVQGSSKQRDVLNAVELQGSSERRKPKKGKKGKAGRLILMEKVRRDLKKKLNVRLGLRKKLGDKKDWLQKRESVRHNGSVKTRNEDSVRNERKENDSRKKRERSESLERLKSEDNERERIESEERQKSEDNKRERIKSEKRQKSEDNKRERIKSEKRRKSEDNKREKITLMMVKYPGMMYPHMALFGYSFKPEESKGFLKPLATDGAPGQASMAREAESQDNDQAVISEAGILLSQKGVDFGTIERKCDDKGAITVNALGCVETRLLKINDTIENIGCSGEHAFGCLFCNYCCKRNAGPYSKGRAQAIAFPCCLFGCIEPEFRNGRYCQWRFQCCCCLQSCCCVSGKDKAYPGYAYPQIAVAGYSIKPTKGCCKMIGENEDGLVQAAENGAPMVADMCR
eukprot:g4019.t1